VNPKRSLPLVKILGIDMATYKCKDCSHEIISEFCPHECEGCGSSRLETLEKFKSTEKTGNTEKVNTNTFSSILKGLLTLIPQTLWITVGVIFLIGGSGYWLSKSQPETRAIKGTTTNSSQLIPRNQSLANTQAKLKPKNSIYQYYGLATNNRQAALGLLTDAWRKEEAKKGNTGFWDSISKVDIYAIETLNQSANNATVKVWIKYHRKNGDTPCESMVFKLIFDTPKNMWLLDSAQDVVQKPLCNS
jgi:hypothetical protein